MAFAGSDLTLALSDFALRVAQALGNRFLHVEVSLKREPQAQDVSLSMTDLIKKWTDADDMPFSSPNAYFGAVLKLMVSG